MKGYSNNIIVALMGPTGCGKDTLRNALVECGMQRIVTYTTRAPRKGERDGVDYHFIDEEAFRRRIADGSFVEYRAYEGSNGICYFGSMPPDEGGGVYVIVLDDEGIKKYKDAYGDRCLSVYMYVCPDSIRKERAFVRNGEDAAAFEKEWAKRDADDKRRFTYGFVDAYADVVVDVKADTGVGDEVLTVIKALVKREAAMRIQTFVGAPLDGTTKNTHYNVKTLESVLICSRNALLRYETNSAG